MAVPHDQIANNTLRGYQPASTVSASSVKFVPRRSAYSASGMSRIGDQRARPHTFGKPFLNNINTQPRSLNEFEHLLCQLEQRVLAAVERQVKERIEALETKTTSLVLTVERQVNEWNERIAAVETENISFGQTLETAFEEHRAFRAAFEEKLNPIDASLANMFVRQEPFHGPANNFQA